MKKQWIFWWLANIIWIILFAVGSAVVWLRTVDGAGVTQTIELKLVAFIVLLSAFIIPFLFQMVWMIVNLKKGREN
ncbi:DUF3923 family protein [Rummeliibacillus sp. POC4]|uniref:DUF3923 family protein n=1 Tax=Rummeliibacillus sp. POC4 TaxID=2305899 RepID=UPI000E66E4A7|nr:DUF3923 family protein [Rummeliibacillus sp. POC4]RIJ66952.1 DUF3923 family protein [Rummeliibacillus sp. POC4]